MIPYGKQTLSQEDIDAVIDVLRSDYLTQGPAVPAFENALCDRVQAGHCVAANSATSALHLACRALGLGPGDWLWTSPITFVASANCALYCGAGVDFVDIDEDTWNMSPAALEDKLLRAESEGRLPKIVVPVHLCGQPCDMEEIHALGRRFGFRIIEDASHATGAQYRDLPVGACEHSDITIFSFHPVKIVTTGEGGAALTNDERLAQKMRQLRSHGVTRDPQEMTQSPDGPWYYQQIDLGYNYRLSDIHAALGIAQLRRLTEFVATRRRIASRYDDAFVDAPLTLQRHRRDSQSSFHLYVIRLDIDRIAASRSEVFSALLDRGIGVNVHYIPVHLQPYYRDRGFRPGSYPNAERYYSEAISLPLFPSLDQDRQGHIIDSVLRIAQ